MKKKVIIIGAGVGGLTTAALLARDGYDVAIYESASQVGGRAGQKVISGYTFDTGPSWYLMPSVFERTFRLLGTSVEKELDLIKLSPAYKVFYESHDPITITGNEATDRDTFEQIEPGAGAALKRYIDEGDVIYQLSLKHFLYTNFNRIGALLSPEVLRHSLKMLRLALTPLHSHVKKYVADRRLQQILEYPMVFLGSSPFSAPAIYSLMSALDFKEGVYYPRGGLYTIVQALERRALDAGVTIHLNQEVATINTSNRTITGITLADGHVIDADIVVSNGDIHHTETRLLPRELQTYPEAYWKKTEPGVSALLLYLGVRGELPELEHHNLLFVDDWEKNFSSIYDDRSIPTPASMYVCRPSATDTVSPSGHENLFMLVPLPTGVAMDATEQEALAKQYLKQFATMTGIDDLEARIVHQELFGPNEFITRFYSYQASALGSSHLLKQSALFRTSNRSKKVRNLYYVGGNTIPGVGIPMCLIGAELVYERIVGRPPQEAV